MKYYLPQIKKANLPFETNLMSLEDILLSERRQTLYDLTHKRNVERSSARKWRVIGVATSWGWR